MPWVTEDGQPKQPKKPLWDYKDGIEFATVLPNTSRIFAMLLGDLDPTRTWTSPMVAWTHEFKVATGFATIICNKWNEACPYCYENELFKRANPNYKNTGGRLPYGLSKKAILQVWDFQEKKVVWLLAGKHIQEGMDFILTRQQEFYKGIVMITRTGDRLNTSYRVDIAQMPLDEYAVNTIKAQIVPMGEVAARLYLTRNDLIKKTGIDPVSYFQMKKAAGPLMVDVSGWGPIPIDSIHPMSAQGAAQSGPPVASGTPPVGSGNVPVAPQGQTPMGIQPPIQVAPEIAAALAVKCTVGVFKDYALVEVIRQTGKPYLQYLQRNECSDVEKNSAQLLLDRWHEVEIAVSLEAF